MESQKGSCFCGEIKYQINAKILNVVNCHCNFCRTHSGAAFSSYAVVLHKSLEMTEGKEKLSHFELGEGKKHFCSRCGTPIFNVNKRYPRVCMLYLGTLENARTIKPMLNVWCESQLPWVASLSSIKSVDQGTEGRST